MTRPELIEKLYTLIDIKDKESAHAKADNWLLEYINDPHVTALFKERNFWYG